MLERLVLGAPKRALARIAEDCGNGAALALGDPIIQIFKDPIQPLSEDAAYAGLARSHKANEEDGCRPLILSRPRRTFRPNTTGSRCGLQPRFARTLFQTARILPVFILRSVF